jgi:hypothetical protein
MIGMGGTSRLFGRQNALDSARYILESMGKEIRMSTINSSDGNSLQLDLKNSKGCHVFYTFDNVTNKTLARSVDLATSDGSCTEANGGAALNPSNVEITGSFYIFGSGLQPRATIVMTVKNVAATAQQVQISLQTTVSSREYQ